MKKALFILLLASKVFSQSFTFVGVIGDSLDNKPIEFANIYVPKLNIGTVSDSSGNFSLAFSQKGNFLVKFSHLGYLDITKEIEIPPKKKISVKLIPKEILLEQTTVIASLPKFRKTPVANYEIEENQIENLIGNRDAGFILENSPSIFVSSLGGGMGDYKISIRGFNHTNIAVMLNGVPVNNPENGEIYWSNWAGIGDVLERINVQRGLGSNPFSVSTVGGSVNFLTKGIYSIENFAKLSIELGSENFQKKTFSFSQTLSNKNLSLTGFLSKKNWNGFADQTWVDEISYYLAIGGIYGNHSLELQAIGSSQEHGQRLTMLTIDEWKARGKNFNSDWGYLNGKPLNLRDNVFHKPTFNLNHNWQIDENWILSNIMYYSYGDGGGTVPPWVNFNRTENGLIDFNGEWIKNSNNINTNFDPKLNFTENALRFTVHRHNWYGLISNIRFKKDNMEISSGLDARYYTAQNYREVSNLLGGDYTIGSSNVNWDVKKLLFKGDKVDYDADSYVRQFGGFVQDEIQLNNILLYANISVSSTGYKRLDYFNYLSNDSQRETNWFDIFGYTIKSGTNYNLDNVNNLFFNIGYFSKAPLAENVYDYTNHKYENVKNEKIFNVEMGYGLKTSEIKFNSNIYYTLWKDKALSETISDINTNQFYFFNLSGASSRHIGIELSTTWRMNSSLKFEGMISNAVNKWTDNVFAVVAPESDPTQKSIVSSYVKNVYVGGSPMTTALFSAEYENNIFKNLSLRINPIVKFYGNHFADFNPNLRSFKSDEGVNSWKLPNYFIADLHISAILNLNTHFIEKLILHFDSFNIFNNKDYIIDALDGTAHNSKSALVWYGRERWWNFSLSFKL
ncbi:MAG: TonB-dependent receptor [Ignavibacteriae bacterium]|nr:TonB-dependent receptor [Ignavibacteriota bacterium]